MIPTFRRIGVLVGFAIILAALLVVFRAAPVEAGSNPQDGQTSNEFCLGCHSKPGMIKDLPSGEQLYLTVDPAVFYASVHATQGLDCVACHADITGFPHITRTFTNHRDYTLLYKDTCSSCHADKVKPDGMHQQTLASGNTNAPICADCHNPHSQPKLKDESGNVVFIEKAKIAQTCARCHSTIYNQYASSVHGAAAIGENNPDVPVCTTCHGVHEISDPTTNKFRLASPKLCANCHSDKKMMAKYNLSTDVYNTYVADFHGTTVTLFQKDSPDQLTNKAVCYDCHGVHNIVNPKDPKNGLEMKQNMLKACQKCHPDANISFPNSWLSHYIPTADRNPLVYYVNLFYKFFIPGVLIPMGIFVLSDVFLQIRRKFNKQNGKEH
jgi:predicted CXXCH cytochrome family protein